MRNLPVAVRMPCGLESVENSMPSTKRRGVFERSKEVEIGFEAAVGTDISKLRIAGDNLALSSASRELRKALTGVATNAEYYRTHLVHPQLKLPRTNNTSEACIGSIESLLKRLRGISNTDSLCKWIEAWAKHKKKIACNGF